MKRLFCLLPVLMVPPALVAAYFISVAPSSAAHAAEDVGTRAENLHAARAAYARASRFLSQAQAGKGQDKELLLQAVVQFRVCLAYEVGATPDDIFTQASQNLEASRLLLVQQDRPPSPARPIETQTVRSQPAPRETMNQRPLAPGEVKAQPLPMQTTAISRDADAEDGLAAVGKPVPGARPQAAVNSHKAIEVGPDGIPFETVDKGTPKNP